MQKNKTCCFTGHREIPVTNILIKNRLKKEIERLIEKGVIYFGAGGALGFDTMAALIVLELREKYPQIKLIMVLPCPEQDKYWNEKDKSAYAYILDNADKKVYTSKHYHKGCMHTRNRHLINNSGICICYLTKKSGGTAYTVAYAMQKNLQIINIAEY